MARILELDIIPAIIANFLFGALWFGPLWGELYQKCLKISSTELEKRKERGTSTLLLLELVGNLLFVTLYKALIVHFRLISIEQILGLGITIWLGFIFPAQLSSVIWEEKKKSLLFIYAGHRFVSILLVANIFCFI